MPLKSHSGASQGIVYLLLVNFTVKLTKPPSCLGDCLLPLQGFPLPDKPLNPELTRPVLSRRLSPSSRLFLFCLSPVPYSLFLAVLRRQKPPNPKLKPKTRKSVRLNLDTP